MRVVGCQPLVGHERIRVESRSSGDVLAYFLLQHSLATARNNGSTNLSAPFQDAYDSGFVFGASSSDAAPALADVHISCFSSNKSLVHFNFAAEFGAEKFILHRKTNPLEHEPCGLLANSHVLGNLVTA